MIEREILREVRHCLHLHTVLSAMHVIVDIKYMEEKVLLVNML